MPLPEPIAALSGIDTIDGLTARAADLSFVESVSYHPENGVDTTPATITVTPTADADTDQLELLGAVIAAVVETIVDAELFVSMEHPLQTVTDDDGSIVDLEADTDRWTVSVRWNARMATTPSAVRHEGYAIDPDTISEYDAGDPDALEAPSP